MAISIKNSYILALSGCMNSKIDSVESIIAGATAGATGSVFNVDLTSDGIPVLCSNKKIECGDEIVNINEVTYEEIKNKSKKIVVLGQAIDLAKSFGHVIAFNMVNSRCDAMIKLALKHADYADNAFILVNDLEKARDLAQKYDDINVVFMSDTMPADMSALALALKEKGIFGICTNADNLTPDSCRKARNLGLYTAVHNPDGKIEHVIDCSVNFIFTNNPVGVMSKE